MDTPRGIHSAWTMQRGAFRCGISKWMSSQIGPLIIENGLGSTRCGACDCPDLQAQSVIISSLRRPVQSSGQKPSVISEIREELARYSSDIQAPSRAVSLFTGGQKLAVRERRQGSLITRTGPHAGDSARHGGFQVAAIYRT